MQLTMRGFFMGHIQGHYILQLCMGHSYFWMSLTPHDSSYFANYIQRQRHWQWEYDSNNV